MRLVEKTRMLRRGGAVDEICEIDLCRAGENEFIVNVRGGQVGTVLKETPITIFPEPENAAREIYVREIEKRFAAGFRPEGVADSPPHPKPLEISPREHRMLELLRQQDRSTKASWPLSRVVWKVGELRLERAADLLAQIDPKKDFFLAYSLIWALGRCGGAPAAIRSVAEKFPDKPAIQRIQDEALLATLREGELARFLVAKERELPPRLGAELRTGTVNSVIREIESYVPQSQSRTDFLPVLYLFSRQYPHIGEALIKYFESMPLRPKYFLGFRHLLKAAEFRSDTALQGLLAYRLETSPQFFHHSGYRENELKKPDANYAYSQKTRRYFRGRFIRLLGGLGKRKDADGFTMLAAAVLSRFDDTIDKVKPDTENRYIWSQNRRSYTTKTTHFDTSAPFLIHNYILYQNSPRYEVSDRRWQTINDWKPGDAVPALREEAFPELWDRAPGAIISLLKESKAERVHEFAVKVFRANPSFRTQVDVSFILSLLGKPFLVSNSLALELCRAIPEPEISGEIAIALLSCSLPEARTFGLELLTRNLERFFADTKFVAALICNPNAEIRTLTQPFLLQYKPDNLTQDRILHTASAILLGLGSDDTDRAANAVDALIVICADRLAQMDGVQLSALIVHPLAPLQLLAGSVLLARLADGIFPEDHEISLLIQSDCEAARDIGMQLLSALDDSALLAREALLTELSLCERSDLRALCRALIARLAAANPAFAVALVRTFYPYLLRKETYPGLHDDVVATINGPLRSALGAIPPEFCWRMLDSRYSAAQQLGWAIVTDFLKLENLSDRQIVKLASHDLREIREAVLEFYKTNVTRIRQNLNVTLGILDSEWEDVRQFGFGYFNAALSEADWTPELLISVCDSVRPDVQAYGREIVTRYFREENGQEYLIKFSQHPSADIQTFATNYLAKYAGGSPERIGELQHYFVTVLSLVNRARVAKTRILSFLKTESMNSEPAARVISLILSRHSAAIAIRERAACIEILLLIHRKYPTLELPLKVVSHPLRAART